MSRSAERQVAADCAASLRQVRRMAQTVTIGRRGILSDGRLERRPEYDRPEPPRSHVRLVTDEEAE